VGWNGGVALDFSAKKCFVVENLMKG